MPVSLEILQQPTEDEWKDLVRIYQDSRIPVPDEFLKEHLDSGEIIYAGHFNGRLIVAALCRQMEDYDLLEGICVRAATRQRGVARQFLILLARHWLANGQRKNLHMIHAPSQLGPMLAELGFHYDNSAEDKRWTLTSKH